MSKVHAYNAMNHAIDLPGGTILPSGESDIVDPDDEQIAAYVADFALVITGEAEDTDEAEPEAETPDEPVAPEPEPATTTKPPRGKRGGNGSAAGDADITSTED